MKKIYSVFFVLSIFLMSACSKDFLKPYDDRIIGTWQIADVNRTVLGCNVDILPFREGSFSFMKDGTLTFTNTAGEVFKGTWDIRKKTVDEGDVYS